MSKRDSKGRFVKAAQFKIGDTVDGECRLKGDTKRFSGKFAGYDSGGDGKIEDPDWPGSFFRVKPGSMRLVKSAKPAPSGAAVRPFQLGDRVVGFDCVGSPVDDTINREDGQEPKWGLTHGGWCYTNRIRLLEPNNHSALQPKAEEKKPEAPANVLQRYVDVLRETNAAKDQEIASLKSEIGDLRAEIDRLANSRGGWALEATTSKRRLETAEAEISDLKALLRASRIIKGICASGLDDAISRVLGQS